MGSPSPLQSSLFVISLLDQHSSVLCVLNRATSPTQTLTSLERAKGPLKTKHPICTFFTFKSLIYPFPAALGAPCCTGGGLVAKSCLTLAISWTCQAPVSMGFSRQEYWSGLPWAFSHCRVGAPSHCGTWAARLCSFSCCGARALKRRLRSCAGAQAQLLCGTWDPPRPGTDPVSPALVGGLPSIVPPGKSTSALLCSFQRVHF